MPLLERKSWDRAWGQPVQQMDPGLKPIAKAPNTAPSRSEHTLGPGASPALSCSPQLGFQTNNKQKISIRLLLPLSLQLRKAVPNFRAPCNACLFPLLLSCSRSLPHPHPPSATNTPPNTFKTNAVVPRGCKLIHPFKLDLWPEPCRMQLPDYF